MRNNPLVYGQNNVLPAVLVRRLAEFPEYLSNSIGLSDKILTAVVARQWQTLRYMPNPSAAVQLAPGEHLPEAIRLIENPCLEAQLATLSHWSTCDGKRGGNGLAPVFQRGLIRSPSEEAQLAAVEVDPTSLAFLENPSAAVCQAAARAAQLTPENIIELMQRRALEHGAPVIHLKHPPELDLLAAVFKDPESIAFIENPSEALCLAAARGAHMPPDGIVEAMQMQVVSKRSPRRPGNLADIPNPCSGVQLLAVVANNHNIRDIKKPTEAAQLAAIRRQPRYICNIKNPAEAAQLAAVQEDPWSIRYIEKPTEATQLSALNNNSCDDAHTAIQYIKNPCEAAQLIAVNKDPLFLACIENPTKAACQASAAKAQLPVENIVEAMQLAAVALWRECKNQEYGYAGLNEADLTIIRNPLETTLEDFLRNFPVGVLHIDNPTEQAQRDAVRASPRSILPNLDNPSESVQLVAVMTEPMCLALIANPGLPVQRAAAAAAGLPEEGIIGAMQLKALRRHWDPLREIKAPTEAAQLYVLKMPWLAQDKLDLMLERLSPDVQKSYDFAAKALGLAPGTPGFAEALQAAYDGMRSAGDDLSPGSMA